MSLIQVEVVSWNGCDIVLPKTCQSILGLSYFFTQQQEKHFI